MFQAPYLFSIQRPPRILVVTYTRRQLWHWRSRPMMSLLMWLRRLRTFFRSRTATAGLAMSAAVLILSRTLLIPDGLSQPLRRDSRMKHQLFNSTILLPPRSTMTPRHPTWEYQFNSTRV